MVRKGEGYGWEKGRVKAGKGGGLWVGKGGGLRMGKGRGLRVGKHPRFLIQNVVPKLDFVFFLDLSF